MSHDTFLIVCAILIAGPFILSCIKGKPLIGLIAGFASYILMGFAAGQGASIVMVLAIGLVIAGICIAHSFDGD